MYFFFSLLSYILIIIFFYSWHPLFMSVMITLQSIVISATIFYFTSISWFSYLLFMIFLGAMMVILIYVSSLASNLMMSYYSLKFSNGVLFTGCFMLFFVLAYYSSDYFYDNSMNFSNLSPVVILSGKMYSKDMYLFTILIIYYLLVLLVLTVKVSSFTKGPLRAN
uniref:NADH dehydrogenase subunit 6 n=1 Tax=Metacrangonyx sp. 3 ssp. 1 MDMBR-2012 TaxID=1200666 RepID=K7ZVN3_9CRUS|nr:NADH dehydrogenase subunit 6 [Metacrangonyx sp. 3 ssp. 1 MDMBR-2012]